MYAVKATILLFVVVTESAFGYYIRTFDKKEEFDLNEAICAPVIRDNIELFVDHILDHFRNEIPDKLPLPNIRVLTRLYDGELRGLPTIYRRGSAHIKCDNKSTTFQIELGLKGAEAEYSWRVSEIKLNGRLQIHVNDFGCYLEVEFPIKGGDPTLKNLKIVAMKGSQVNIRGFGILDWVASKIATGMADLLKKKVTNELEEILQKLVCKELHSNFPKLSMKGSICEKFR